MGIFFDIGFLVGFLCLCYGGVLEKREKRFEERCGRDFHTGPGTIELPTEEYNGTYMYSALAECHWTIETHTPGAHIMLASVYFSLEISDDCRWDYVEIIERGGHPEIHRYCGWDPVTYISASNHVTIRFRSDESYEDKGFSFKFEIKDIVDATKCNSSIYGPDPGSISGSTSTCFYNIRSGDVKVIELDLTALDFGNRSCDEKNIQIFKGFTSHGKPLVTICKDASIGFIGVRESNFFIAYKTDNEHDGGRFQMQYRFVENNFTPAPTAAPKLSPVGGDDDCSGLFIDPENGELTYTTPTFQDNKHCIVVIRNTLFDHHVVEITFTKFEMEDSTNCTFDSLEILAGERADSARLGGALGKLYCGEELRGRTFTTNGNSLRLTFITDESFSLYGFEAKVKFVPSKVCECGGENMVCVRTGIEKVCVHGSKCLDSMCQNGGKCVSQGSDKKCICRIGFSGSDCSIGQAGFEIIHFTIAPQNRQLVRGEPHYEDCRANVAGTDVLINYMWTFNGEMISPFTSSRGFGMEPGGLLRINSFTDQMEGTYSCIASTESGASAEQVFEYDLIENCPAGIEFGPKNVEKKVGENVLFPCYAPTAVRVTWKKDGRLIDFDHETRFTQRSNNYLQIIQLEETDEGIYRCEARSSTGCHGYREGKLSVLDVKPLNSYCGRTIYDESVTRKISTGTEANPAEYPWHVVFRGSKMNGEKLTFCGGSLVSQNWVMTAAHCIMDFRSNFKQDFGAQSVKLYIGASDCFGTGAIIREPANVIIHENFNTFAYMNNDIALIELSSPVEYTDKIKPICIEPDRYTDKVFFGGGGKVMMTYGKVSGCGDDWRRGTSTSRALMEISIPHVDRDDCENWFEEQRDNPRISVPANYRFTDKMICAGNTIRRTGDTCKGDSGGALVMVAQNRWVQTGIVSFGIGCDRGNYGVYTNVGKFYDWIKKLTGFDEEFIDS